MDQTVLSSKVYPYTTIQTHSQSIIVNQIDGSSSGDGSKAPVKRRRKRRSQGSSATTNEDDVRAIMEGMFRKRKLTDEQVIMLEHSFENEHKLESGRKEKIAGGLGLDPRQVAVWFQNRRARWKNKKLEEEYANLKSQHESLLLGQSHLESQVLKLTEQLSEAQNEIQKLSERLVVQETSTNSSSSSLSVEANDTPTDTTNYNIPLYMLDNSYLQNMEYWDGLFQQF